jgi:hypothetical protein
MSEAVLVRDPGRSARPGAAWEESGARLPCDSAVSHEALWWKHQGNRVIHVGDCQIVAAGKDAPWELFDLAIWN